MRGWQHCHGEGRCRTCTALLSAHVHCGGAVLVVAGRGARAGAVEGEGLRSEGRSGGKGRAEQQHARCALCQLAGVLSVLCCILQRAFPCRLPSPHPPAQPPGPTPPYAPHPQAWATKKRWSTCTTLTTSPPLTALEPWTWACRWPALRCTSTGLRRHGGREGEV